MIWVGFGLPVSVSGTLAERLLWPWVTERSAHPQSGILSGVSHRSASLTSSVPHQATRRSVKHVYAHNHWNPTCSTPLPWLPVLSNITAPHLRRQEATAKLLTKVLANYKLPLNTDITLHPAACLSSRKPVCLDPPSEDMTANSAWSDEWAETDVVNQSLVAEPLVFPPGFDLSWRYWSMLNWFRTGKGPPKSADSFHRQTRGSTPVWTRCGSVAEHAMQTLRRRRYRTCRLSLLAARC